MQVESIEVVRGCEVTCCARLHLCDLAGSERQEATAAAGERLKEASHINTTLHVLRRVVQVRLYWLVSGPHMLGCASPSIPSAEKSFQRPQ